MSYIFEDGVEGSIREFGFDFMNKDVATPLWPSVGVKPNTPTLGDLESSGTPECLVLNSKA